MAARFQKIAGESSEVLSIGVIIPTRNSMGFLPAHLASIKEWVDIVAEIIVVDSESTDGTVEFIRANLKHPCLRIVSRPRGLYQAWNFGAAQIEAKYSYFSTIGDLITREGLQHLSSVARSLQCDVVISPPHFVDTEGKTVSDTWPIHRLISGSQLKGPRMLSREETILAALSNGFNSFLGSSASNLYRADFLKKHPFPCDFGHMGDTAWGIQRCSELAVAVTPQVHSTFLFHPKEVEPNYSALAPKLLQLAQEMKENFCERVELSRMPEATRACDLLAAIALEFVYQHQINEARKNELPFFFNARAFFARMKRNRQRLRVRSLRRQFNGRNVFISQ